MEHRGVGGAGVGVSVGQPGVERGARGESEARPRGVERDALEVGGAEGLVRDMISWMARRSLRRCRGLLMPISRWISVSDRADMMAPLFTLARHAATYQAGIPTHSCGTRIIINIFKGLVRAIFSTKINNNSFSKN